MRSDGEGRTERFGAPAAPPRRPPEGGGRPPSGFDGHSIPRKPRGTPSDFERLRARGVELIQELSGDVWTDYNLHDPGVTILEQLCYALTDLMYRARFPVRDHLSGPDGAIDFTGQALHRPEVIFPCRPTTPGDYRRLVLDRVHELENVWVERSSAHAAPSPDGAPSWTGVYRTRIHVRHGGADPEDLRRRVLEVYRAHRNLGEDVDPDVRVADEIRCELGARIEIAGGRPPEAILAEVYARARRQVAGDLDAPAAGEEATSLEELFTGPPMERGFRGGGMPSRGGTLHVADLVSAIRGVEGVVAVDDVSLVVEGEHRRESVERVVDDGVLCLVTPGRESSPPRIRLTRSGRPVPISVAVLRQAYAELSDARRMGRRARSDPRALYREPRGAGRDDAEYRTIQDHFPAIYGINRFGVSASARPAERARVAQLRAYLLPMEQLLADQLVNIRHLRDLFSTSDPGMPTYRHQVLVEKKSREAGEGPAESVVAGVARLYRDPPDEVLDGLYRDAEEGGDRRSRILDAMLAVFGESFAQRSLRQFEDYRTTDADDAVVRNKIEYLRSVVTVGRDRGGGFDYSRPSWTTEGTPVDGTDGANASGFQRRVGLLLGLERPGGRSLVDALTERGLRVVGHDRVVEALAGRPELELVDVDESYEPVAVVPADGEVDVDALKSETFPLSAGLLTDSLFTRGIRLDAFRLGRRGDRHVLVFRVRSEEGDAWWYVGDYRLHYRAVATANSLRAFLARLNAECEGFHVLEHVLLRPAEGRREHASERSPGGDYLWSDFYPLRVSLFFSGWTARCSDERFRLLAEETVRLNCPAHVHPECHWLGFEEMRRFEKRYRRWLDVRAGEDASAEALDEASVELIRFVLARQAETAAGEEAP